MPVKTAKATDRPIYSPGLIKKYTRIIDEKVAEVWRKQNEGKLPYRKPAPIIIVEIPDIMRMFGRSERTAQRHMAAIRKKLCKKPHEFVSVEEFIDATGLPEASVRRGLNFL